LLENIVDPSASVGKEFRVSTHVLNNGRVVTGVVVEETQRTLMVQTQKEKLAIDRSDLQEVIPQGVSLMPDGLLKQLTEEQIRDLFAYLDSHSQVRGE
jgi:putative heme-binding domain-containing protein